MSQLETGSSHEADDVYFRARTTQCQFAALARRCTVEDIVAAISVLPRYEMIRRGKNANNATISRWLKNGWNTEFLLRQNATLLDGDALRSSLQWAFPQSYYSAYTITCAFFNATGLPEATHASVLARHARLTIEGCYPYALSFAVDGAKPRAFHGLKGCELPSPFSLDPNNPTNVDEHIRRFLNATREADLLERRYVMRAGFKTARGANRKSLTKENWDAVSAKQGPTGLLSLLYRKRIKANYRDIDTFVSEHLNARALYSDLICVTAAVNAAHEALVCRAIGVPAIESAAEALIAKGNDFLEERLSNLRLLHSRKGG